MTVRSTVIIVFDQSKSQVIFKPVSASIFLAERLLYNSLEGMIIIGHFGL